MITEKAPRTPPTMATTCISEELPVDVTVGPDGVLVIVEVDEIAIPLVGDMNEPVGAVVLSDVLDDAAANVLDGTLDDGATPICQTGSLLAL